MSEYSGRQWCERYQTSRSVDDLAQPFQDNLKGFLAALSAAGASIIIAATLRPVQRAYLMHWCCQIAGYRDKQGIFQQISPADVPPMDGVGIDWACGGDIGLARTNAVSMRTGYGIVFPAALVSRHTQGLAVDMNIQWHGALQIKTRNGNTVPVYDMAGLIPVGATYDVIKLVSDVPHWSQDGR